MNIHVFLFYFKLDMFKKCKESIFRLVISEIILSKVEKY